MTLLRVVGHAAFALLFGVLFSGVLVLLAVETLVRRRSARGGLGGVLLWEEIDSETAADPRFKTRPTVPTFAGIVVGRREGLRKSEIGSREIEKAAGGSQRNLRRGPQVPCLRAPTDSQFPTSDFRLPSSSVASRAGGEPRGTTRPS